MPIRPSFAVSPIATVTNAFSAGRKEQRRYLDQLQLNVAQMQQRERLAQMQMRANLYSQQMGQAGAMQRMQYGAQMDATQGQAASRARNQQMMQQFSNQKEMLGLGQQNRLETMQQGREMDITSAADEARGKLEYTLGKLPENVLSEDGITERNGVLQGMKDLEEQLPRLTPRDRLYAINDLQGRAEALGLPRFKKPPEESIDDLFKKETRRDPDGTTWTREGPGKWKQHLPQKGVSSDPAENRKVDAAGNVYTRLPDGSWQTALDMQKLQDSVYDELMKDREQFYGPPLDDEGNEIKLVPSGERDLRGNLIMVPNEPEFRQDKFDKAFNHQVQLRRESMLKYGAEDEQQQGAYPPAQQGAQGGPPQPPPGMAPEVPGPQQGQPPGPQQPPPPAMPPAAGGDGASAPPPQPQMPPGMPPQGPPPQAVPPGMRQSGPIQDFPIEMPNRPEGYTPAPTTRSEMANVSPAKAYREEVKRTADIARARLVQSETGTKATNKVEQLLLKYPGKPLSAYSAKDRKAFEEATTIIEALGRTQVLGEF